MMLKSSYNEVGYTLLQATLRGFWSNGRGGQVTNQGDVVGGKGEKEAKIERRENAKKEERKGEISEGEE